MSPVVAFSVTNEPLSEETKELEALFREHSRLVFRTAYYVTRSAADAEDVAQGVFLHLLNRGVPPGLRNNPKGYLYRCAINLSLSAVRSRDRRAQAEAAQAELTERADGSNAETELLERLAATIPKLNPREIEMLVLRYEHGFTDAETGRLLGMSRAAVTVALFRARARLKKLLRTSSGE
jgi:RNA polymerase sigma-70 factor (ECF subfamily)